MLTLIVGELIQEISLLLDNQDIKLKQRSWFVADSDENLTYLHWDHEPEENDPHYRKNDTHIPLASTNQEAKPPAGKGPIDITESEAFATTRDS